MPVGGAFDRESQAIANTLVGNEWTHHCYEAAMCEVTIDFDQQATIAIVGAEAEVSVNGQLAPSNCSWRVSFGDQVRVAPPRRGCRTYIAVSGLRGDLAAFESTERDLRSIQLAEPPSSVLAAGHVGVLFPSDSFDIASLTVLPAMDRLGVRCRPDPQVPHTTELASVPICPGTLQVTPDGTVIVIGPDGPTIGGYPIAGYIRREHLCRVAQWTPGMQIEFGERPGVDLNRRLAELRLAISV